VTPLDDFLPYVIPDCPGVSDIGASDALISAMVEFCNRSLVLQRDHDPIDARAYHSDYELSPPEQMIVAKVMKAWFRGSVLTPMAPDDMDDPGLYNPAMGGYEGAPLQYVMRDERTLSLWPRPQADEAAVITLRVALRPSRKATAVEDVLFEDWVDVVAAGAKAALQMVPGKTYSNPVAAKYNDDQFKAGTNRAMVQANKGHTRADLAVRPRRL